MKESPVGSLQSAATSLQVKRRKLVDPVAIHLVEDIVLIGTDHVTENNILVVFVK